MSGTILSIDRSRCCAALRLKGEALEGLKRYDDALAAFNRAIGYVTDDIDAWKGRARTLRALGRGPEAREAEQHAQKLIK